MFTNAARFNKWWNFFEDENPMDTSYPSIVTETARKDFVSEVDECHQDIRKKLGGNALRAKVSLKKEQYPINVQGVRWSLFDNLYPPTQTLYQFISRNADKLVKPTIKISENNEQRVAKWIKDNFKIEFPEHKDELETIEFQRFLSSLGDKWSNFRSGEIDLEVTISTTPKAFMLLGHYGADDCSCFQNGGEREFDKIELARYPNTFVVTLHTLGEQRQNVGRAWGKMEGRNWHTSNLYLKEGFREGNYVASLAQLISQIEKTPIFPVDQRCLRTASVYHNDGPQWNFLSSSECPDSVYL